MSYLVVVLARAYSETKLVAMGNSTMYTMNVTFISLLNSNKIYVTLRSNRLKAVNVVNRWACATMETDIYFRFIN